MFNKTASKSIIFDWDENDIIFSSSEKQSRNSCEDHYLPSVVVSDDLRDEISFLCDEITVFFLHIFIYAKKLFVEKSQRLPVTLVSLC
ncbi:hypothetical protein D210916BOD24_10890 [Alteromonas sp. D210916BOD_24]